MADVTPTLWIVSPVYHDVPSFVRLREEVRLHAGDGATGAARLHFVVCDDAAGQDPQIERLQALDDVTVLTPPFNLGHQRALVYALRHLGRDVGDEDLIVTMDADGDDRPEDVPRLVRALQDASQETLVAIARRTRRQEAAAFRLGYRLFTLLFRAMTGTAIRSGNFACLRAVVVRRLLIHPYFDLSYASTLISLQIPAAFVDCERGLRYEGQSRMGYSRLVRHGLAMLVPFTDRIALRALASFSLAIVVSVLLALAVVAVKLFTDRGIPGWATSTVLGLMLLSFVALGNVVVLFAIFTQSRGISLANLEHVDRPPEAPPPTAT